MRHRHPVALDMCAAHRGGVEEQVDEVVVQQVDLVDVQHSAVRLGEQARLVGPDPVGQRPLQVQRPDEPVLRGADGQLDEPRGAGVAGAGRRADRPGSAGPGAAGSQENRQSGTTVTAGRSAASARTAVDFAVPFSPRTSTPPTPGCTALSSSARRRSSWPTTAENGNRTTSPSFDETRGTVEVITSSLPDRRSPSGDPQARRDR